MMTCIFLKNEVKQISITNFAIMFHVYLKIIYSSKICKLSSLSCHFGIDFGDHARGLHNVFSRWCDNEQL